MYSPLKPSYLILSDIYRGTDLGSSYHYSLADVFSPLQSTLYLTKLLAGISGIVCLVIAETQAWLDNITKH